MNVETRVNWQALMEATLVPPPERFPYGPWSYVERPPEQHECECPDLCSIDHEHE